MIYSFILYSSLYYLYYIIYIYTILNLYYLQLHYCLTLPSTTVLYSLASIIYFTLLYLQYTILIAILLYYIILILLYLYYTILVLLYLILIVLYSLTTVTMSAVHYSDGYDLSNLIFTIPYIYYYLYTNTYYLTYSYLYYIYINNTYITLLYTII